MIKSYDRSTQGKVLKVRFQPLELKGIDPAEIIEVLIIDTVHGNEMNATDVEGVVVWTEIVPVHLFSVQWMFSTD